MKHTPQQKLLQFFMTLNESYNGARSFILMVNPLPSVGQAYSLVEQEEYQREMVTKTNNADSTIFFFLFQQ